MDTINQLIEILKSTPQLALWGVAIFLFFRLATLASWVYALKVVTQLAINKYFESKKEDAKIKLKELDQTEASKVINMFKNKAVNEEVEKDLFRLLRTIIDNGSSSIYIHSSTLNQAIKILDNKENWK